MNLCQPVRIALVVLATAGVLAPRGPARGDIPVAPAPEAFPADASVVPAAHGERQAAGGVPLGPVPLPTSGAAATPDAAVPRPLPDWRLLLALGGAFAAVAAYRLVGQRRPVALPPDVFEVLGEAPLGGQQSVRVIRFGPRTLLVAVSATGVRTLAEVNDPQATERMVAACHGGDAGRSPGRSSRRPAAGRGAAEASS